MNTRVMHQKLGWVAACVATAWALTGFLHPVMSWTAPRAAVQAPLVQALEADGLVRPSQALSVARLDETALAGLVTVEGAPFWFADDPASPQRRVVDARTGLAAPHAEAAHATALARHYAGLPDTDVVQVRLIDRFSLDYPAINRFLPVWEVRFDTPDGLTIYADTGMDRLAAVTNGPRRVMLAVFQTVHTLSFLEGVEPLRLVVLSGLIATIIATSVFGAFLLVTGKGRGLRRAHRLVAWAALPLVMMFTLSGLFHLVMTTSLRNTALPAPAAFRLADLPDLPAIPAGAAFVTASARPDGAAIWRIEGPDGIMYAAAGGTTMTDPDRAQELAGSNGDAETLAVKRFTPEYGFADKRLPVVRGARPHGPVFVDVREGRIARTAQAGPIAAAESWSFDTLHKWQFLNPIGKRNRDYATMAATVVILLTVGLGLVLQVSRRRRRQNVPD